MKLYYGGVFIQEPDKSVSIKFYYGPSDSVDAATGAFVRHAQENYMKPGATIALVRACVIDDATVRDVATTLATEEGGGAK